MKFIHRVILGAVLIVFVLSCSKAPITGRSQLIMVNESEEMQLGLQSAKKILSSQKLSHDPVKNSIVQRVGKRIASIAGKPNTNGSFML